MNISHSPHDIYVTRLDFERLTQLVQQEHPAASSRQASALKYELTRAHIVDSYAILPDVVTMNSRLKLRAMDSGEELLFTLVYPDDADDADDDALPTVSILHPVGVAVLGCRLGDKVHLLRPEGLLTYWVEAILHQPEATGDWMS